MILVTAAMSKSEALAVQTLNAKNGAIHEASAALMGMKKAPPEGHTVRSVSRAYQFLWEKYNRRPAAELHVSAGVSAGLLF